MFEERLKDILADVYCGRVIVFSNYTARESLYAKGITPAIFLHKYYSSNNDSRISYTIKDKTVREMCRTYPIDAEQFDCYKDDKINKTLRDRVLSKSKLPKEIHKQDLSSKLLIENYLKSLNFFWFEEASRIFLYAMSLDEGNFRLSTLEQPFGIAFMLEVEPGNNVRTQYQKVRKQADVKLKKMFAINPTRIKTIPTFAILLQNAQKGATEQDGKAQMQVLRQDFRFQSSLLCRVEINGPSVKDSVDWSSYPRVILKNEYKLQPSDPIRIIGQSQDNQLKQFVFNHRQKVRQYIQQRLKYLGNRYEEANTTKNRFLGFFKGTPQVQRSYNLQEAESREIADLLFLLGDYKKAVELYKDLAQKFQPNDRDQLIFYNISELIQLGKCLWGFAGGQKMKAYQSIRVYAQKSMLKRSHGISKVKMYRYLIYIMFFLHGFRIFDRQFIKNSYYYYIKKAVNQQTPSQHTPIPSIMPTLIHQQYANLNLLYPTPEFRRYGYDVVRVASKFNQFRLYEHHLRCLLIASYIYRDTFPVLEKYINSALSRTYLQLKKYRFSLERIQITWKNQLEFSQDFPIAETEEQNEFSKLYSTQLRGLAEIERVQPQQLTRETDDCIPVPKIFDIKVEVLDERLESGQYLGSRWQDVGDVFLGEPELTSKGMSKQNMIKYLKMYDAVTAEEKELAYRSKNISSGPISEAIIKRNSRTAFIREPIIVSFCFKNPLPMAIEVNNIKLHLKTLRKCTTNLREPNSDKIVFKPGQKIYCTFQIIPEEIGLYQFSHISWTFFKMTSIYRFKEPWQSKSTLKSFYFKLNVLDQSGQLSVVTRCGNKLFQGQQSELEIILTNEGTQPIQQVYLAIDNQNIFGFKLKLYSIVIAPNQTVTLKLKARMPVLKSSNFLKCITKAIFLYRTAGQFRMQRAVTCFNVQRIAEITNIKCERISKNLHFLSFSMKYASLEQQQQSLLKSLIIKKGFQIKKVQTNRLDTFCQYFFFIRKNSKLNVQQYKFTSHTYSLQSLQKLCPQEPDAVQNDSSYANNSHIRLLFLWWDKEDRFGVIDPLPIAITATECEASKIRLPFNVKILLQDEIECNFEESIFAQLQVNFSIKNIFDTKDINMSVEFIDGQANDFYWQGTSLHNFSLKFNQERKMKIKLVSLRAGIFNIARNIRYTININKAHKYSILHNDYESLYFEIKENNGRGNRQSANFDFFEQFQVPSFKKTQKKQQVDLI